MNWKGVKLKAESTVRMLLQCPQGLAEVLAVKVELDWIAYACVCVTGCVEEDKEVKDDFQVTGLMVFFFPK